MKHRLPGRFPSAESFRAELARIDSSFTCDLEIEGHGGALGEPCQVLGRTLSNRFAIHPMEGWDGTLEGAPGAATLRRWRHFGESGASLIWGGEAVAVTADGRANPNQLCLAAGADPEQTLDSLRTAITEGVTRAGSEGGAPLVGLQLTHSGRFARPEGAAAPRIAVVHPVLDERVGAGSTPLSDGELEGIAEAYGQAARFAQTAGFDFVDVKACHGYLLHELLGARSRPGKYGGDLAGRARLLLEIIDRIQRDVPGLPVAVRLSAGDVFPFSVDPESRVGGPVGWDRELPWLHGFGLDTEDPRQFDVTETSILLGWLQERGVSLVNVTFGSPYWNPHIQRPAAYPPVDGYPPPEDPLHGVFQQLSLTRTLRAAHPDLVLVGSGYSYLQEYLPHVAQHEVRSGHVDLVGLGRMVLSYPELPRDVLFRRSLSRKLLCRTFSDCTNGPRMGLVSGCFPLDSYYREHPDHETLSAKKRARREPGN